MVYIFAGSDFFTSYKEAKKKVLEFCASSYEIVNADEINNPEDLRSLFESIGFFEEQKTVFAKRLFKNKKLVEYLQKNWDYFNRNNLIIWEENNLDQRTIIVKNAKKQKTFFQFEELKAFMAIKWVEQELKKEKIKFEPIVPAFMVERLGVNKAILNSEISKIKLMGESITLTQKILAESLSLNQKGDIWVFLENFSKRRRFKAICELEKLLTHEDLSQYIIAMLEREIRLLAQVKAQKEKGLSDIKLNPFVLKKTLENINNFTWADLKIFSSKLLDLDLKIKTGHIDPHIGLVLYLNLL